MLYIGGGELDKPERCKDCEHVRIINSDIVYCPYPYCIYNEQYL